MTGWPGPGGAASQESEINKLFIKNLNKHWPGCGAANRELKINRSLNTILLKTGPELVLPTGSSRSVKSEIVGL